jgi:hypothetical protein
MHVCKESIFYVRFASTLCSSMNITCVESCLNFDWSWDVRNVLNLAQNPRKLVKEIFHPPPLFVYRHVLMS